MPSSWQRPYRAQLTRRHARAALKSSPFASQRAAIAEPLGLELRVVHVRVDLEAEPQLREVRTDARSLVTGSIRELDRLGEGTVGLVEAPGPEQRVAEVAEELRPPRVVGRHQGECPRSELDPGASVPTRRGGPARAGEAVGRASRELVSALVDRTELGEVPMRLLEVPADDLGVLGQAIAGRCSRANRRSGRAGRRGTPWSPRRRRRPGSGDGEIRRPPRRGSPTGSGE